MQGDILPYLKDRTFDPDATRTMEEAYGKARRMLGNRSQPPVFLEVSQSALSTGEPPEMDAIRINLLGVRWKRWDMIQTSFSYLITGPNDFIGSLRPRDPALS